MVFEKRLEIRDPELLKRIYQLRNEGSGFNNISKIISTEFDKVISHPTIKNLYYEYAAKQNIKKEIGEKIDDSFEKLLNDKFLRIEKITSSLLDAVDTIKDGMDAELYLKHAPTIISILRESLNQLTFIRAEQKEITVKQQNLIYSPIQVLQEMNRIESSKIKDIEAVEIPIDSKTEAKPIGKYEAKDVIYEDEETEDDVDDDVDVEEE